MAPNPFGAGGWTPDLLGSLAGKSYVVTGGNGGAGFEASRVLLSKGGRVLMLNRSAERSAAAVAKLQEEFGAEAPVSFVVMDLASLASVREAAARVLDQADSVDALICNAAIAQIATQKITVDGFESQLGVNHLAHFLLCGLLFERIEASQGRFVVVGSNGYKMGLRRVKFEDLNFDSDYSAWAAYSQSKLAQMMFGYELQRRVAAAGKPVEVHVCHPGASRTNLIQSTAGLVTRLLWGAISWMAQSAEHGSWPEVMCATEDDLKPETLYGPTLMEMRGAIGVCPLEPLALDKEAAARLWTLSEEKTGLSWAP